jgi:serine/threonine protein kinase
VWLARNVMGMPRAVKIIRRSKFESDRPYEREFAGIQGYEPVSRSADGLVHVLHVGRNDADGYFYYVMELADSIEPRAVDFLDLPDDTEPTPLATYAPRTLRSDIKRLGRLPVADCIRVAHDVVAGLVRLHDRGLVHRDVKPGNIIFIDGRAKLADVGLVSRGNEGRTFVGTEGYIPPEGPGTPAADLYALGMVLYESVTGYPPDQFPKVPTEWFKEDESTDSLELYAVVLKACEGAKERRYQNADELQADLALLQSGQSVRHLRALEERVARWRRIGWVAAVSLAIAVSTALVANWREATPRRPSCLSRPGIRWHAPRARSGSHAISFSRRCWNRLGPRCAAARWASGLGPWTPSGARRRSPTAWSCAARHLQRCRSLICDSSGSCRSGRSITSNNWTRPSSASPCAARMGQWRFSRWRIIGCWPHCRPPRI